MRNRLTPTFCSNRRQFLCLAAGAAALPAVSRFAWAQAYPTRPVRIIVALAPAGTVDIIARLIGQWLSERLGEQFLIENRPGAGTNLGVEAVVRAPPDGYTLLMIDVSAAFNATLYDKLNFNFVRDIAPVANVVRVPNVIAVHPSFPAKTVPEFIAYAKANPGKISMATAGVGSSSHVFGELFKMTAGVDLVAVPYRGGGPALIDMLSGQVHVIFVPTPASIEYVRAGRLRALGVTSTTRVEILPDLPQSPSSCLATRQARGTASARPETRRPRLLKGSTRRSIPPLPTQKLRRSLPTWRAPRYPDRLPILPTSSRTTPRNGARSSARPISSRSRAIRAQTSVP